ncbi:MAG: hypothetical protein A2W00_03420 [Candidatus Eisenbacteria bacterium RBG_16_71_46]|nr:MAG: hypothetical protein A2W00_03420 [Candidatus Eisenbacteria bacterium RBG_16_71_46]
MTSTRQFSIAARLGVATTLSMFGLIVVGSVVRTTGSGLACPDWPLCQGRLIPPFEFHVLVEWFHRLLALGVSVLLVATAAWVLARGTLRSRLGGLTVLALVLLAAQVLLGALTVWKLLDPSVVGGHLAVALLLFAIMVALTLIARSEAEGPAATVPTVLRPPGLFPTVGVATVLVYVQAVLGGVVSTHHAGLACPDWPTCNGQWFPPLEGLTGLQVLHRYGAYLLTGVMFFAAARSRSAPEPAVRAGAAMALWLTLSQAVLGVCNVLLGTPPWLSAAHIATAAAILAVMVTVTLRAAALPAAVARLATAEAS